MADRSAIRWTNATRNPGKLRGGYYTPMDLAHWLCAWAIRSVDDRILEPSCGDGVFLEAAARAELVVITVKEALLQRRSTVPRQEH